MPEHVLLGCITTELQAALKVAAILSRSHVGVCLNTSIPQQADEQPHGAPFQILVLSTPRQVSQAINWLTKQNTQRFVHAYETPLNSSTSSQTAVMSNEILSHLNALDSSDSDSGSVIAVHLLSGCDATLLESNLGQQFPLHRVDVLNTDVAGIRQEFDAFSSSQSTHIIATMSDDPDFPTITRGTESARLVCGNPNVAAHLPALLRLRGWLLSSEQRLPVRAPTGHQIVLCSNQVAPDQIQIEHFAKVSEIILVDVDQIDQEHVQSELLARIFDSLQTRPVAIQKLHIQLVNGHNDDDQRKAETVLARLISRAVCAGASQFVVYGESLAAEFFKALRIEHYSVSDELAPGIAWLHGTTSERDDDLSSDSKSADCQSTSCKSSGCQSTCCQSSDCQSSCCKSSRDCAVAIVHEPMDHPHPHFLNHAFDALNNPERQSRI